MTGELDSLFGFLFLLLWMMDVEEKHWLFRRDMGFCVSRIVLRVDGIELIC